MFGWAKQHFCCWRPSPQGVECPHILAAFCASWAHQLPVGGSTQVSLAAPSLQVYELTWCLGACWSWAWALIQKWSAENDFSAQAPAAQEIPFLWSCHVSSLPLCMHIPTGHLALQACNRASNQLGKLTAGVSYFLFRATSLGYVNSMFPRSPDPPHLGVFSDVWRTKLWKSRGASSNSGHALWLQKAK